MRTRKKTIILIWGCIGIFLCFYPLWTTGITHNDELLILYGRENSLFEALKNMINNELEQGRILRLLSPLNWIIGPMSRFSTS